MNTAEKTDHRKVRGDLTRRALMNAAERLMATRGMGNVTIRQIVSAAKQKTSRPFNTILRTFRGSSRPFMKTAHRN